MVKIQSALSEVRGSFWIRIALLLLALALGNAPYWALGEHYAMERAFMSVDLLLALAVMAWRPLPGLLLLIAAWAADGVVCQSILFHFNNSVTFLDGARFANDLTLTRFVTWEKALVAVLFGGAAWALLLLSRRRRPEWGLSAVCLFLLFGLDVLNGSSRYALADRRLLPANIAGSPVVTMIRQFGEVRRHDPPQALPRGESVMETAQLLGWARAHPDGRIWLVVVESMGWPLSDTVREQMTQALDDPALKAHYSIESQRLPFRGSTTYAELRALCALKGRYADLQPTQAADCLPAKLDTLGWQTIGLHGFTGKMFDRREWWPTLGFRTMLFQEDLRAEEDVCDGAFEGICDAGLLHASAQRLIIASQTFVYTLTLNTHLPLDPVPVPPPMRSACVAANLSDAACEMGAAQQKVLASVASQALRVAGSKPLIVVVGDHAPPFVDKASRSAFDQQSVPAFVLRPR